MARAPPVDVADVYIQQEVWRGEGIFVVVIENFRFVYNTNERACVCLHTQIATRAITRECLFRFEHHQHSGCCCHGTSNAVVGTTNDLVYDF